MSTINKIPTFDEVLATDALDIFGVINLEIPSSSSKTSTGNDDSTTFWKKLIDSKGHLSETTINSINRQNRKLSIFFHPDKNPAGRDAFEKLQKDVEFLKDPVQMLKKAHEQIGDVKKHLDKINQQSAAEAARTKLAESIAKQKELRRQQAQKAAAELQNKLKIMRGGASAVGTDAASSSSIFVSTREQEILARERRAQMSEWEILEEEMLADWDVDVQTLNRKESDVMEMMNFLKKRSEGVSEMATAVRRGRGE